MSGTLGHTVVHRENSTYNPSASVNSYMLKIDIIFISTLEHEYVRMGILPSRTDDTLANFVDISSAKNDICDSPGANESPEDVHSLQHV